MSFTVSYVGKPDAIRRELDKHSTQLTGQGQAQFGALLPGLKAVLDQSDGDVPMLLEVHLHVRTEGVCV